MDNNVDIRRKTISILALVTLIIVCGMGMVGCGNSKSSEKSQITDKETKIAISTENYYEYFNIKFSDDFREHMDPFGKRWFSNTVTVTCRSTVTASFSHVVLTGKVQLPVNQKSHLLYTENKLPLEVTIVIDGTGFGEDQAGFQHGTGSYGGYSSEDFYFECTSASGYIELK